MSKEENNKNSTEFLLEMAKNQGGVACATVKDGHVLIFTRQTLLNLVEKCNQNDSEQIVVFVKKHDGGLN